MESRLTGRRGSAAAPAPLLSALLRGEGSVSVAGARLSYGQILDGASLVADRVSGAAVVAVEAAADVRTVVAVVGCLLAGVTVVPIAPDSGPAEREHMLADSGAALVLTPASVDPTAKAGSAPSLSGPEPDPGASALILYTSGTSGAPKGVPITRAAIAAGLDALAGAWAWTAADVLVHGLPLFHVHGLVLGVLGALRTGSRLVHTGSPRPADYARAAQDEGGSLFFGVPTVWSRVAADAGAARALGTARLLVSGSAPLPVPVFERLDGLTGHRPVERYGMTETLITVSSRADGERRPGFVGTPLAGVTTRLADDGRVLPPDGETLGELQIRAPMVFGGYVNRPEASAASFTADGWFRTGDVATVGPDGWHRIVGRASTDLIKSGGYRIGAGEVEDCLLAVPGVREAAVVGQPDDDLGERVTAFVVADGVTEQQLITHVATQLAAHKRPRSVVFVDALPRNPMGKVLKRQLASG
jgi:fatty acid CoA ligase FadD36